VPGEKEIFVFILGKKGLNSRICRVPEQIFRKHQSQLMADLYRPDIAGIYELQLPLDFRSLSC
jgi:hypothetical protein